MKKKYNLFSNVKYMLDIAIAKRKNKLLLFLFIYSLAKIVVSLLELFITPNIVNMMEEAKAFKEIILASGLILVGLFILNSLIENLSRGFLTRKIEIRMTLLKRILVKNLTMSYPLTLDTDLKKHHYQVILSLDNQDSFPEKIWDSLSSLFIYISLILIYILILAKLPILLIVVTVVSSFVSFYINRKIKDWRFKNKEEEASYQNELNYIFKKSKDYKIAKDIKMFGLVDWFNDISASVINMYNAFLIKLSKKIFFGSFIALLFDLLRNSLTYYYLIQLVLGNKINAGGFLLVFATQGQFSSQLGNIFNELDNLIKYSNDLNNFRAYIDYPDVFKKDDGLSLPVLDVNDIEIELKNVSYKYPNTDSYTLENINLLIRPKDKIAIVGMNGSGKTTLVKLIMGLLDPSEGEVLLNGKNIKQYNRNDYYKLFSPVFQEHSLLPESLRLNIRQNAVENKKALDEVVKLSGLQDKVNSLDRGLDTPLGKEIYLDGEELSGGEMQKLLMARALYRNSPVLILDEPTAALDPLAEKDLYNKYHDLTSNYTSIFISHRLASTRFCDYILLIDDNKIKEKGSHEDLIKLGGSYKYLFDVQSQYYKEDFND